MTDTPHHSRADRYKVEIGDENLTFRTVELDDPVPTGRQLIQAAGARPVEEFVASAFMADGTLEDLRLDELFDCVPAVSNVSSSCARTGPSASSSMARTWNGRSRS